MQLSNLGQLCGGDWRGPRIDWRDLAEHAEGLICLAVGPPGVGLLASYVERADSPDEPAEALAVARRLAELYDDRLYLTLAFHGSLQAVANAIKPSKAYVSRRVRIYQDPVLAAAVLDAGLAPTTAQEFLPVKDGRRRRELVQDALREGWDAPQARAAVKERCDSQQDSRRRRVVGLWRDACRDCVLCSAPARWRSCRLRPSATCARSRLT